MGETQKKITICTSLNEKMLNDYGYKTLTSFKKNIPLDIDIDLYFENSIPNKFDSRFNIKELFKLNLKAKEFVLKHKANPRVSSFNVKAFKKNYIKFCYKVFTICTAARNTSSEFLIWLDLDIFIKKKIDQSIINYLCDEDYFIAYLNRELTLYKDDPFYRDYSETGIITFNLKNTIADQFFLMFENVYLMEVLFLNEAWDDACVFDNVRTYFENKMNVRNKRMSDGITRYPINDHELLDKYFIHPLGAKKNRLYDF